MSRRASNPKRHQIGEPLLSPRTGARVGDFGMRGGKPVMMVKAKGNEDYLYGIEILEMLYGRRVKEIIFEDGSRVA